MTFLNPLVLFGLAAAAIPVILHLLNLRKLKTIEFSTLAFLKELQQTKIRRLKVRQLLLLLIRTLIVVFIVLAFSRPALRGSILGTIGSRAHSTVVFILDDSFSLTVSDERGDRLKQLKEAALRIVDLLKDGDEVFLLRLSDLPKATVEPAMHDFEPIRAIIREMPLSMVRRSMEDAIRVSARLLALSSNANREVYIITDLQGTLLAKEVGAERQSSSLFDERVRFFLVPIGTKPVPNTSVDSIAVVSRILEKNRPMKLYASVRNFSTLPLRNEVVSVFLDKVRAAQTNVSVDPMGTASVNFTVTPKRAGILGGHVELEDDAIEVDNRRYFHVHVPSRLNVALVTGGRLGGDFLAAALRSSGTTGEESPISLTETPDERFPLLDLKNVDVLIVSNVRSFSNSDAHRIQDFLARGGGMLIFPGDDINKESYNTTLFPLLDIPPLGSLTRAVSGQTPLSFKGVDVDHPLFETMFEPDERGKTMKGSDIESPGVTASVQHRTGKRGRTLIGLSDGTVFLSEYRVGQGTVLVYSVAPSLAWSDFPLKGLFAPLMYRSVMYAGIGEEAGAMYLTGEAPTITLRRSLTGSTQCKLVGPDGLEDLLQSSTSPAAKDDAGAERSFTVKPLLIPGVYELRTINSHVASIAVNVDRRESDTRTANAEELAGFWKRTGIQESAIQVISGQAQVHEVIMQSRFGVELWKYCSLIALLLVLLEMLIARDSRNSLEGQPA